MGRASPGEAGKGIAAVDHPRSGGRTHRHFQVRQAEVLLFGGSTWRLGLWPHYAGRDRKFSLGESKWGPAAHDDKLIVGAYSRLPRHLRASQLGRILIK